MVKLQAASSSILSMPFEELAERIGGSGKAKTIWQSLRQGINPLEQTPGEGLSTKGRLWLSAVMGELKGTPGASVINDEHYSYHAKSLIPVKVEDETLSSCGTRKLLIKLQDGGSVESVLIPSYKFDRTTLCVSTQIGCDRGCVFCATGKMGIIRNLTSDEIIGQVVQGMQASLRENMPKLTNVVLMGMGDAGRNVEEVGVAVRALTDRDRLSLAQSKVTISTVGPSPQVFMNLAALPGTLAWSLHTPDDALRRKLVPSTRHTTEELRDGLLKALETRSAMRLRTIMIACTLIDGVNDSLEDARKLAEFIRPMLQIAPKIAIDLIPYNDISYSDFKKPSREKVNEFQSVLRDEGFFASVRVTRGDDESAACGMLSTKNNRKELKFQNL